MQPRKLTAILWIQTVLVYAAASTVSMGAEYCFLGTGEAIRDSGCDSAKLYPGLYPWPLMQPSASSPIDFTYPDEFVREYQAAGIKRLMLTLNTWADGGLSSKNWAARGKDDHRPKPEYEHLYTKWVGAMVERYDGDGIEDMPGLMYPVRDFEIGTEFSTYEPESGEAYVGMLRMAYRAAHNASGLVNVMHAAFFVPLAFPADLAPDEYEASYERQQQVFAEAKLPSILNHSYEDLEAIFDAGDAFDSVNVHSLLYPSEIYGLRRWVDYNMESRVQNVSFGYPKPLVISDTAITPFIAFGNAVDCTAFNKGFVFPPATEADRCRLADYFSSLMAKEPYPLSWVRDFSAADVVKRLVMSAHNNVTMINMAFTEDIYNPFLNPLTAWAMGAGAGNSIWSGMMDTSVEWFSPLQRRKVNGVRPPHMAMQRLSQLWMGYRSVESYEEPSSSGTIYRYVFETPISRVHVIWLEPFPIVLPGDPFPVEEYSFATEKGAMITELDMYCWQCLDPSRPPPDPVPPYKSSGMVELGAGIEISYVIEQ